MYSGPAGFYKAPLSKLLLFLVLPTSLLCISSPNIRLHWTLTYQALFLDWQLWRLVPAALAFHSLPELVFGGYLLYFFRLFERQYGSSKYAVFLLFSCLASLAFECVALLALAHYFPRSLDTEEVGLMEDPLAPGAAASSWLLPQGVPASGPYGLIFASLVLYALEVPATAKFTLFSLLHFSNKAILYVAGLQLLLSSWTHSLLPGACGLLAGSLFYANALGLRKAQMPAPIVDLAAHYFSFLLTRPPSPLRVAPPAAPAAARQPPGAGAAPPGTGAVNAAPAAAAAATAPLLGPSGASWPQAMRPSAPAVVPRPSPELVEQLLAMGFDRESAVEALTQARNDLTLATNILLESQQLH